MVAKTALNAQQQLLVTEHLPAAQRIVGGMIKTYPDLRRLEDDLLQAAYFGLMRASMDYDPTAGAKFSTYAYNWIIYYVGWEKYRLQNTVRTASPSQPVCNLAMGNDVFSNNDDAGIKDASSGSVPSWGLIGAIRERLQYTPDFDGDAEALRMWDRCIAYLETTHGEQRTRWYMEHVYQGRLLREIGDEHGCSREWVRQVVEKVGRTFEQFSAVLQSELNGAANDNVEVPR